LGVGVLGFGPKPQSPIPNPQSPIPNPHIYYILTTSYIFNNYNKQKDLNIKINKLKK
jgi:hypothetical protein